MTARDFCYWLQGFFELGTLNSSGLSMGDGPLTPAQSGLIRRHLAMVFAHEIDPAAGGPAHQALLDAMHATHGKVAHGAAIAADIAKTIADIHRPRC